MRVFNRAEANLASAQVVYEFLRAQPPVAVLISFVAGAAGPQGMQNWGPSGPTTGLSLAGPATAAASLAVAAVDDCRLALCILIASRIYAWSRCTWPGSMCVSSPSLSKSDGFICASCFTESYPFFSNASPYFCRSDRRNNSRTRSIFRWPKRAQHVHFTSGKPHPKLLRRAPPRG